MHPTLRLIEDFLTDLGVLELPALPRMIFVVRGSITLGGATLGKGEVWYGTDATTVHAGHAGTTLWRWELLSAATTPLPPNSHGISSREKLAAPLETLPDGDLIWRGDSVAFPSGGVAYLHRHQGPGIRCVAEGELRIDTLGHSNTYRTGEAWFESGPDPVFAQVGDRPTRFIRVMILPRALIGKSSIQYVNAEDQVRPKSQQYRVFVDVPLTLAG
jgi:quercetin dioxygenase-like cupin family protein